MGGGGGGGDDADVLFEAGPERHGRDGPWKMKKKKKGVSVEKGILSGGLYEDGMLTGIVLIREGDIRGSEDCACGSAVGMSVS